MQNFKDQFVGGWKYQDQDLEEKYAAFVRKIEKTDKEFQNDKEEWEKAVQKLRNAQAIEMTGTAIN